MKYAVIVSRILLGALFIFAGAMPFIISAPPPQPGLAGAFDDLFFRSHWVFFVSAAQAVIGVLLLINRFVPVALIMLAAFLYNSFAFHLLMAQSALVAPIAVLILGVLAAQPYRTAFAALFTSAPDTRTAQRRADRESTSASAA